MKRSIAILAMLSIMTALFGCGGGGSTISSLLGQPEVTAFTMPATATSLTVAVTSLTATNATGVMITESSTAPAASDAGWTASAPATFTFSAAGTKTAYAWAKNSSGTVSSSRSATVVITVSGGSTGGVARPVTGTVTDPVTGLPVANATVTVQLGSLVAKSVAAPVTTVTTDATGTYSVTGLIDGTTYSFEITITGYATFTYYNIIPSSLSDTSLERVSILPSSIASQTATASGSVKNASTNGGLPNMTVKLRSGINNQTGTVRATATTDATGAYSFAALTAGTYTAEVTGNIGSTAIITSYFTLVSIPTMTALNTNQDFSVTTPITSAAGTGQFRIVLSWGNAPSDLDSHLTGPTTSTGSNATAATRFHIYYSAKDYPSGSSTYSTTAPYGRIAGATTEAFLDVDNTSHGSSTYSDNGPETTTIVVPRVGNYKFYVKHYSGSSTISASGAQVKVYRGSALLASFNPPYSILGTGSYWSVFSLDVTASGQTITPINTISTISGTLPKVAGDGFEDYLLFANLPLK